MKRLAILLLLVAIVAASGSGSAMAGPVIGQGADSEQKLADRPDTKPVKCIGLVNMSGGTVLPPGKVSMSLKYSYVHKDSLYDGGDEMSGRYNGKYDRVNQCYQLTAKAGLFENFDARIMIPFHEKQLKRNATNAVRHMHTSNLSGVGDAVLMGRYALLEQKDGDWLNLALGAGLKLPTGDSDAKNPPRFSNAHTYLGPGAQLGTGSWDPQFELGVTKFIDRSRFDAHFMYTVPGDGAHGSRKGNQFKYNFGYGYALNKYFDVELELNGVDQAKNVYDSSIVDATGGHTIYITPGVHWKFIDNGHLSLGVPLVVYRDLNGYSATPERDSRYGLGEDYKIVTRLGFSF